MCNMPIVTAGRPGIETVPMKDGRRCNAPLQVRFPTLEPKCKSPLSRHDRLGRPIRFHRNSPVVGVAVFATGAQQPSGQMPFECSLRQDINAHASRDPRPALNGKNPSDEARQARTVAKQADSRARLSSFCLVGVRRASWPQCLQSKGVTFLPSYRALRTLKI